MKLDFDDYDIFSQNSLLKNIMEFCLEVIKIITINYKFEEMN